MNTMRRRWRLKLAGICTAGMLFQGTQCALTGPEVTNLLVQNVGSLLINSWVNDLFNVQSSQF